MAPRQLACVVLSIGSAIGGRGCPCCQGQCEICGMAFRFLQDENPWPACAMAWVRVAPCASRILELVAVGTCMRVERMPFSSLGGEATARDKDSGEEGTSSGSGSTGTGRGSGGFGTCLERERSSQVESRGDPSVLDLFVYQDMAPQTSSTCERTPIRACSRLRCARNLRAPDPRSLLWLVGGCRGERRGVCARSRLHRALRRGAAGKLAWGV